MDAEQDWVNIVLNPENGSSETQDSSTVFARRFQSIPRVASSFASQGLDRVKVAFLTCISPFLACTSKCRGHPLETHDNCDEVSPLPKPSIENIEADQQETAQVNCIKGELFVFLRVMGRGGYGSVHKVRDEDSKIVYAYKVTAVDTPFLKKGFSNEVWALRQLEGHSNIVQLFSCDIYTNEAGLLMEFIEYTVRQLLVLRNDKLLHLKSSWIKSMVSDLLTAVGYIHSKGIIHFDLKPDNLLITRSGILKIADFGLSEQRKDQPFLSPKVTVPYRPPECYLKKSLIGHKVDIWSCGAILLELITGKLMISPSKNRTSRLSNLASAYALVGDPGSVLSKALREKYSPVPRLTIALQRGKWASAASLAQYLLRLNPDERVEADAALMYAFYFFEQPRPTPPDLTWFPSASDV